MATLTTKLTLSGNSLAGDNLNQTVSDILSVLGQIDRKTIVTSATAAVFVAAATYTDAYVFLMNKSTTTAEIIHIRSGATDSADIMSLGAGEFAFFPWSSDEDLVYDAATGTPVLEVMVFQAAA